MDGAIYPYRPLKGDEIRLLNIEPIGSDPHIIRCSLEHVSLPPLSSLPSGRNFKGNDYLWPESRDPHDTLAIFKNGIESQAQKAVLSSVPTAAAWNAGEDQPWRHDWGDYIALSYVWGNPIPEREITLDGHPFPVSPNLSDALLQLRQSQRVQQGFKLWVDAICINQTDIIEGAQQIARMRDIYASAWQVAIWLGVKADDSDLAFTTLHWLSLLARSEMAPTSIYAETKMIDIRPIIIMWSRYKSLLRKEANKAVFCLLTRPYWRRMWILQEVAMARADAPVLCGSRCLAWRDIYDSVRFISNDESRLGRDIVDSVRPRILRTWTFEFARSRDIHEREWASERMWKLLMDMGNIQSNQQRSASPEAATDFLRPLLLGREAAVTKEEDRVYGILGMREIADRVTVVPDYTLSLADLYQNFTFQLLSNGDLNILRLVSREAGFIYRGWNFDDVPPRLNHSAITPVVGPFLDMFNSTEKTVLVGNECRHDLPSWAVCWTCKPAPTAQLDGRYQASGSTPSPRIPPSADWSITVRGTIFDSLCSLSSFHSSEVDTSYPVNAVQSHLNQYGDLETTRTALWRTLVGDTTAEGALEAPETYSWLLEPSIWKQGVAGVFTNGFGLHGIMNRNKSLVLCGHTLKDLVFGPDERNLTWWQKAALPSQFFNPTKEQCEALSWAMNATAWRRLVGTDNGRMGLAPAAARVGDALAVLLGCSTPMVLRRSGDGWKVIGECYVHGVMHGEMIASQPEIGDIKLY